MNYESSNLGKLLAYADNGLFRDALGRAVRPICEWDLVSQELKYIAETIRSGPTICRDCQDI